MSVAIAAIASSALAGCVSAGTEQPKALPSDEATEGSTLVDPCAVFTENDLEAIFDVNLGQGMPTTAPTDELLATARECSWSVDGVAVQLGIAQAPDFTSGVFTCPSPGTDAVEPVPDIGTSAWWKGSDGTGQGLGELLACSENTLVEVRIAGGSLDPDVLKQQALAIAEVVLTATQ